MILLTIVLLFILTIIAVIFIFIKNYMETKENQQTPHPTLPLSGEKKNFFERYSYTLKVIVVGILTLLLLIPLSMIESLIRERQNSKQAAVTDITSKWGAEQTITGPCLVIPYTETVVEDKKLMQVERNLLILPETLDVKANTSVEKRKRGIYDASVYTADMTLTGSFEMRALKNFNVPYAQIQWNKVQVIMGLSDLKGIKEKVTLVISGQKIDFESGLPVDNLASGSGSSTVVNPDKPPMLYDYDGYSSYELFTIGLNAKLDSIIASNLMTNTLPFSISLKMNGSQGLYIVPIGKTTTASVSSNWATPSFDGNFLPETREISSNGFTSGWKALDLNRSYGQVVRADNQNAINQMASSRFGVRFIQAVDQYQQNMRSVKYAILIILLTFVVLFFIELIKKKSVNPMQYLLVGLALALFYTLLLSMSEVWGFNAAYFVAAAMTAGLITLHMSNVLKNKKEGILIGSLLVFLYLFIFILIQMESYALLVGSLGLFAILGVIMYVSKRIKM